MKKTLFALLLFSGISANAQIPEAPKNIPSPNVYSFVQYTNIPVSHFTGLPNVSIPFAEGKYKDIEIPISLAYNYSGFRPEQHPGWVGMGFDLNVGGVISRTVKGEFPDEFEFDITPDFNQPSVRQHTTNGFLIESWGSSLIYKLKRSAPLFYNDGTLEYPIYKMVPHQLPYIYNPPYRMAPVRYVNRSEWLGDSQPFFPSIGYYSAGGKKDAFSDEYSFNFMGFSGKFMIQQQGGTPRIVVQSDQNVKIEIFDDRMRVPFDPVESQLRGPTLEADLYYYSPYFMEKAYPKTISGFRITADNGYQYLFGKNIEMFNNSNIQNPPNAFYDTVGIEYSIGANSYATNFWTADSWYLTRIVCPDGKKIDFEYERKEKILQEFEVASSAGSGLGSMSMYSRQGRIVSPVYLKKVTSDFFRCDFFISKSDELRPSMKTWNSLDNRDFTYYFPQPNTQFNWYKLDSLKISGNNIGAKSFKFDYNNTSLERLFLKKITEYNGVETNGSYEFFYENSKTLPPYLTAQTDHWGYWNGKANVYLNYDNLPSFLPAKDPDFSFTTAGSLIKIKYPTGGEAGFEYQQNTYSKYVPEIRNQSLISTSNNFTGGQRVKRIVHFDPVTNNTLEKKYFYVNSYNPALTDVNNENSLSSGISTRLFKYTWNFRGSEGDSTGTNVIPSPNTYQIISDQSVLPVYDSYNVNYSKVFEVETGKGYTYYNYSNFDNGHGDESYISLLNNTGSPYTKFSSKSLERGRLLEVAKFNQQNDTVSRHIYTYKQDRVDQRDVSFIQVDDGQIFPTASNPSGLPKPTLNATGCTFKFFTYRYLKDKEINYTFFNGKKTQDFTQYFYDNFQHGQISRIKQVKSNGDTLITKITYPSDYSGFLPSRMIGKSYLNTVIDKKTILKKMPLGEESIISGELYEYKLIPGNSQDVWLKRAYALNTANPIPLNNYAGFSIDNNAADWATGPWTMDSRYTQMMSYDNYDLNKNPGLFVNAGGQRTGVVYNKFGLPVLTVLNKSSNNDKAIYTSFEGNEPDWILTGVFSNIYFKTGKKSFKGDAISRVPVSDLGFPLSNIDLWALKSGPIPTIRVAGAGASSPEYDIAAPVLLSSFGDWNLYRYVTPANYPLQTIHINTNSNWIDEVRVYSSGAKAQSYTYSDDGVLLNTNDQRNNITTYEYDNFWRLKNVKDQNGNIIKSNTYNFKQ